MKRMDSFSRPPQSFVFLGGDGISVKPEVPKITAYHFTSGSGRDLVEAKTIHLQKVLDYYGRPELDPARL